MADSNKTVYILDSYGLIYRCYFAFISRPLTNSEGKNISALFGFFRNLHYIFKHYKPKYIFAAMDSTTKTFRHEKYPEYKATRNKTPDDLHAQIPWIQEILKAAQIPVLQCDGYEADDIIATVAKKCAKEGRECKILSGDKDLMQLVNENTQILKPESSGVWKITNSEGVFAEWGVYPEQLKDLLSLYGDTADNIPGVKGIGVKTAGKLLSDYKTLDGIYQNIQEISGSVQKKLIDGKENAFKSRDLIELCYDVPCPKIDEALNHEEYNFSFANAGELLKNYGAFQVAKAFSELALENGEKVSNAQENNSSNQAENSTIQSTDSSLLENKKTFQQPVKNSGNYKGIFNSSELEKFINSAIENKTVALDLETDSLDTQCAQILGFSLCFKEKNAVYVPIFQGESLFDSDGISKQDAFIQLKRLFLDESVNLIFHNAKFDLKVLAKNGLFGKDLLSLSNETSAQTLSSIIKCKIHDTMIAFWLENPEKNGKSLGLEYLAETFLGLKGIEFSEIVKKGETFKSVPIDKAISYAAEDADFTFQLFSIIKNITESNLYSLEIQVLLILAQMELTGLHLEKQALYDYKTELQAKIQETEEKIYSEVKHPFNIASPKQLQTVLFEERKLPTGKKTKTGYSTDTSVLEELSEFDIVPKMILEYRELAKLLSTYVETLPEMTDNNDRIHTDFVQTGTATGRLSSREPNLQNIPVRNEAGRKIRTAFTSTKGKILISADYSQIELVVLAHLSGDENMCRAFKEGTDVHRSTASLIFGVTPEQVTPQMRRTAKTINFGVIYGMSAFRLAKDLAISRTEAKQFIDNYFKFYSKINAFISETISGAEKNGYVSTIFGRKREILNINSKNKLEKSQAERIAVNTPVQGSAADIVKKAMVDVSSALIQKNNGSRLLLQVHDELIFECPDEKSVIDETIKIIQEKMENAVKLSVPLKVSVEFGTNWGAFH